MKKNERIPLHDHVDGNSGGRLASGAMANPPVYTSSPGTSSGATLQVEDEGTPLSTAADTLNFVGSGVTATGSGSIKTITIAGAAGSLNLFLPETYGAIGDGTTDDTTALNDCHAAANAAGHGTISYQAAAYKATGALTAITAPLRLVGNGMTGSADGSTITGTKLICTSGSANFLTISSGCTVRDLALVNTAGSVTAGYGLGTSASSIDFHVARVSSTGFWTGYKLDGGLWSLTGCYARQPHKYGYDISYAAVPDGGDWTMTDCMAVDGANSSDAAIHQTSGGGGKIVNLKVNSSTSAGFAYGIDVAIGSGNSTSILLVANTSIENLRGGDAIRVVTTGTGRFGHILINDLQVGLYSNNSGYAVNLSAASTGGFSASGGNPPSLIGDLIAYTDGTARAAISLTNTDRTTLGAIQLQGFNARYTSSGDTNTTDTSTLGGGVTGFATPSIGYGTPAGGAATTAVRSDATIAKPTAADVDFSADVTTNNATTGHHGLLPKLDGNAAHYLDGSGALSTPAGTTGTQQHILLADGHATPFAFTDLLQMDDGSDFMWSDS